MATENVNNANRVKSGRHWPYLSVIAVLAVALVAAMAFIINGQTKLRNELVQIRSASSNTSTAMNTQLDTQGNALNLIKSSLQQQAKAESQAMKTIQAGFTAQNKSLDAITTVLQQQTAVIYAAIGKVIPVTMPAEFDAKLSNAEHAAIQLARHEHPDRVEVKNAISVVAALALKLPPWAEQDYLPRFNALRWALATEYLLAMPDQQENQTAAQVSDTAQNLINQMDSMPNPAKSGITTATLGTLANHLTKEARDLQSRANVLMYDSARANALACLTDAKQSPSAALDGLQPWLTDKRYRHEATILADKIRPLVAEHQAGEIMNELDRASAHLTGSLLAVATGGAYNQLAGIKISLASRGVASDPVIEADLAKCQVNLQQIAAHQAAKQAERSRAYQAWAMRQIEACETRYKVDKKAGWHTWQYKDIMNAAIADLLPIQQGYLTVAVQQEYNQEFTQIWNKLAGRDDQTQIAKEEAIVTQLSPVDEWKREHGK